MKQFGEIKEWISRLGADSAAAMVVATADLALIVDADGVIRACGYDDDLFSPDEVMPWVDQPWQKTVTGESEDKLEQIITCAHADEPPRWRHVNHMSSMGELPVVYSAVALTDGGHTLAIGRDLRSTAELQQRLIEAQQVMEQDHSKYRQLDARYRLLEQLTSDGVLLMDGASTRILEANDTAAGFLGTSSSQLAGKHLAHDFSFEDADSIQSFLEDARSSRSASQLVLRKDGAPAVLLAAAGFRSDGTARLLARISSVEGAASGATSAAPWAELIENAPDAVVITNDKGRILQANTAVLDLLQLGQLDQVIGETLDGWLERPGVDQSVLLANLKERGVVRLFATSVRSPQGSSTDVEISATALPGSKEPAYGFLIRAVSQRLPSGTNEPAALPKTMKQMTDLVGRVSLKELVRETTDVIERMCIETALQMTGNNRASAAELLGVSRQILYVKLRKYGLHKSADTNDRT